MSAPGIPEDLLSEPRRRALVQALEDAGGELTPGELSARTGIATRTCTYHLKALRKAGHVAGPKGRVRLQAAGALALARVRQALGPAPGPVGLGELIDRWPTVEQQSFLRLGIGEVVARHLYGAERSGDLLGLAAIGADTGTGKTQAGLFIARVLGMADELALCRLPQRRPGEILGRLEHVDGRWQFVPASRLARPLVVLDEWEKADRERRDAALACLDNGYLFEREGELFEQRAVPLLTANKDRPLPEWARRRAIVLDTDPADARGELDQIAALAGELAELQRASAFPTVDLDALLAPALTLPGDERRLIGELLSRSLTAARMRVTNPGSVELLALAYHALMPSATARMALVWAVSDYLIVSQSTDGTREGWEAEHFPALGPVAEGAALQPLAIALALRQQRQRQLQSGRDERQLQRAGAGDELAEQRAAVAQTLTETVEGLRLDRLRSAAAEDRTRAKGISERLKRLRQEVTEARATDPLARVLERAGDPLARGQALVGRIERERETKATLKQSLTSAKALGSVPDAYKPQAEQLRRQLAALLLELPAAHGPERDARERQAEDRQRTAARAAVELKTVHADLKSLEKLTRRTAGDPLTALKNTQLDGRPLLTYQPDPEPAGRLDRLLHSFAPGGTWSSSLDPQVFFLGTPTSCEGLQWGAPTDRVLAPALARLRQRKAELAPIARAARSTPARRRASRGKPSAAPATKRPAQRAPRKRGQQTKRAAAGGPELGRCPRCNTTQRATNRLGWRVTCKHCQSRLEPVD